MVTDPVVRIGDRCMIGRGSHIVGHFQLEIGDDVHTGPYVYITDQNHGYEDPDQVVHAQWPSDVPVLIGDGSWLGTGVVILPGPCSGRTSWWARGGRPGHLPRPLRDRRGAGPCRPTLRPRFGMGRRQVDPAAPAAVSAPTEERSAPPMSTGPVTVGTDGGGRTARADRRVRSRSATGSGRPGEGTRHTEPVAAHHLRGLVPTLLDQRLGGGEVIEVTGSAFGTPLQTMTSTPGGSCAISRTNREWMEINNALSIASTGRRGDAGV